MIPVSNRGTLEWPNPRDAAHVRQLVTAQASSVPGEPAYLVSFSMTYLNIAVCALFGKLIGVKMW